MVTFRIAVRGFIAGAQVFEEFLDAGEEEMAALADRHAQLLFAQDGGDKHMIEIEFLDEPNQEQRFFRIGTDPAAMVWPIPLKLVHPL